MAGNGPGDQSERRAHCRARRQLGHGRHAEAREHGAPGAVFPAASRRACKHDPQLDGPKHGRELLRAGRQVWIDGVERFLGVDAVLQPGSRRSGAVPEECARHNPALSASSVDCGVVRTQRRRAAAHDQRGFGRVGAHARPHALLHGQLEPGESAQLGAISIPAARNVLPDQPRIQRGAWAFRACRRWRA